MYKTKISALITLLVIGLVISATPVVIAPETLDIRPMIFVHGFSGSGAQFESQAMRFTSNGYPANYIATYEYDSLTLLLNPSLISQVLADLNNFIDTLRTQTGFDQVDLIGHSMGTMVGQGYLNSWPGGAAKVAHYVNIDGATAGAPPGGVPTLAIWGMGHGDYEIVDATNVYFLDQSHVQVCTSAEPFVEMYKFFTGEEPVTTRILPEPPSDVVLAGRALYFIENVPVQDAVLNIWQVDGNTGARIYSSPEATYALPIDGDGSWGPFNANGGVHYEFALIYATDLGMMTVHYYYQPFIRSDYLIRLFTDRPAGGLSQYMMTWSSNTHSNLIFIRYKEFWGDQVDNDILAINGTNIVNAGTCPISKSANAIYCFDEYNDTVSNIDAPVSFYYGLPFLTGVDLYIPAAIPPNGTTSIVLTPRGGGGLVQLINVPNWGSTNDVIVVQFNDYVQGFIFKDSKRGTELRINADEKYFQFIAPDKTFSIKHDPDMTILFNRFIIISFEDSEIKLLGLAIDTRIDFCVAFAKDMQTGQIYWLVDRPDNWICGDIDFDGDVDGADFSMLGKAYRATPSSHNWDAACDIDGDDVVDSGDLSIIGKNYRKSI